MNKEKNLELRIERLEKELEAIKRRNTKVETDKAWETSAYRVGVISLATYITIAILFYFIGVNNFLVSASIPVLAFILSTRSLPIIKKWWIKSHSKR